MGAGFVFPGQGSQAVGMLAPLVDHRRLIEDVFAEASAVLGCDLLEIVDNGPRERLDQTEITQPAMLAAGVATWRIWREQGGAQPRLMAGHSLGEYSALVCAGAIEFPAAVALVQVRARAMQGAVPAGVGAMAAILGLDDNQVEAACAEAGTANEVVEPVNYNAPGQVVIAGHKAAVERAIDAARSAGARRAVLLPVSVPSHSSLMRPAAEQLSDAVASAPLQPPGIGVISSVDAQCYSDVDHIRANLLQQVHSPVRWVATVEAMVKAGCDRFVECGPGKVLTGLNRRITKGSGAATDAIVDPESLAATLEQLGGST